MASTLFKKSSFSSPPIYSPEKASTLVYSGRDSYLASQGPCDLSTTPPWRGFDQWVLEDRAMFRRRGMLFYMTKQRLLSAYNLDSTAWHLC
jgi:hypothetical protein